MCVSFRRERKPVSQRRNERPQLQMQACRSRLSTCESFRTVENFTEKKTCISCVFGGERGGKFKDGTIKSHNPNFACFMRSLKYFRNTYSFSVRWTTWAFVKKLLFWPICESFLVLMWKRLVYGIILCMCVVFYCRVWILLNCAVELVGVSAIVAAAQNLTVDNTAKMW